MTEPRSWTFGGGAIWHVAALAAGIAAVALLCRRFGLAEVMDACASVRPATLLAYLACGSAVRLGLAVRWNMVARTLDDAPSLGRLLSARLAGDALGALLPTGRVSGDPLRALLVVDRGGGGARASAAVAVDRILELLGNTLCAIAYVTVFAFAHAFGSARQGAVLLVGTLLLLLLLMAIPLAALSRGLRPLDPMHRIARGVRSLRVRRWMAAVRHAEAELMRFLRDHPGRFAAGVCASLCIEGLQIGEYWLLLSAFGITLDLPSVLMTLVASGMARIAPTPAGLGAMEASQVAVQVVAGRGAEIGFVVGVVLRLHETLWTAVGVMALSFRGVSLARLRTLFVERPAAV